MIRYLLDTNIAGYLIRGTHPPVERRLARLPVASVGISCVTEAELLYGLARRPEATRLRALVQEFLACATVLPWDSARGFMANFAPIWRRPAL